jgi:methionine-rich copper-binding protein CopC
MKPTVPALAILAALAVPAAASAHPSVHKDTAQTVPDESQPTVLVPQTRYVVANHGFTYVLRETNDRETGGVFDYKSVPGPYRATLTWDELVAAGTRGAQAHATCEVASLTSEQAIRSWQGDDPFYAYVPFQKRSAGLEDDPAMWIPEVKARTGIDLAGVADPAAACAGLGGTYVPADETQSSSAQFNSGLIEHETDTLKAALADAEKATLDLQGLLGAARGEVAKLTARLTPMTITLPSATMAAKALRNEGTTATVSGPAGAEVTVGLTVPYGTARRLKLASPRLDREQATLGADGTADVALRPGRKARNALKQAKKALALTVAARTGDRIASSGATATLKSAGPAPVAVAAHTELKSTRPARGGSAGTGLRSVTATFNQAIRSGTLKVKRKGGSKVSLAGGGRDPRKISRLKASLKPGLKAGRYKTRWSIKAADGHEQSGSFSFRLR